MKKIIKILITILLLFTSFNLTNAYNYEQIDGFMGKYYSKLDYKYVSSNTKIGKLEILNRKIDNILLFKGDNLSLKNKRVLGFIQFSLEKQIEKYKLEGDGVNLNEIFGDIGSATTNYNNSIDNNTTNNNNNNRCFANGIYINNGGNTSFYKDFSYGNGKRRFFVNYKCRDGKLYELSRKFKSLKCNFGYDKVSSKCVKKLKRIYISFDGIKTVTWQKIPGTYKYEVLFNNFSLEVKSNKFIIPNYAVQGSVGNDYSVVIYALKSNGNTIAKGTKRIGELKNNCLYQDTTSNFIMFHNDIQSKYVEEKIFGGTKKYKKEFSCNYGKIVILSERNVTVSCENGFLNQGTYCRNLNSNSNSNNGNTSSNTNSSQNTSSNTSNSSAQDNSVVCNAGSYKGYSYTKINNGSFVESSKSITHGKAFVKINCNNGSVSRTVIKLECNSGYSKSGNYCR